MTVSVTRLRARNNPSSGFIPEFPGGSRNIDAGYPRPLGSKAQLPDVMAPRYRDHFRHQGSGLARGGVGMANNDFHSRRDRGWRRGFPLRHSQWVPKVVGQGRRAIEATGAGYRGVGNIHVQPGMKPPRTLLGLLPRQVSDYKPFRYPLDGGPGGGD